MPANGHQVGEANLVETGDLVLKPDLAQPAQVDVIVFTGYLLHSDCAPSASWGRPTAVPLEVEQIQLVRIERWIVLQATPVKYP
jgi:hypothetical protein